MHRPPLPPFTLETAAQQAQMADEAWNSRDLPRIVLSYTDARIPERERKYRWSREQRPAGRPSLSRLGF